MITTLSMPNRLIHVMALTCFTLTLYVILSSGSRVGLLSLLIGLPVITYSLWPAIKRQKRLALLLLVITLMVSALSQSGIATSLTKIDGQFNRHAARIPMYTIAGNIIHDHPLTGVGMGRFLPEWTLAKTTYLAAHPDAVLPETMTLHPHNELLLWGIEGGLPFMAFLLSMGAGLSWILFRLKHREGALFFALLLPITLHTQVETPFYLSALHWFVWLTLIALVLQAGSSSRVTTLSWRQVGQHYSLKLAIVLPVFFFIALFFANKALLRFVNTGDPQALALPAVTPFYVNKTQDVILKGQITYALQTKNKQKAEHLLQQLSQKINSRPKLYYYQEAIDLAIFLNPAQHGCRFVKDGLAHYANNHALYDYSKAHCQ